MYCRNPTHTPASARLMKAASGLFVNTENTKMVSEEMAVKLAKIYLETPFDGGRHALRVQQISQIENGEL